MQNVNNVTNLTAAKKIIADAKLRSMKNGIASIGTRIMLKTITSSSGEAVVCFYIDGLETSESLLQAKIANEPFTMITHKRIDD